MKYFKLNHILLLVFIVYYLLPLSFRDLWQPDETRYAEISREMLKSGDWIVPHFLGLRYFEKPSVGYWINNLSQLVFGHTNFAVHFGSACSIILTTLIVYRLAIRLWNDQWLGITAVVIYSSSLLVYTIGTFAVLDPMVTLWLTAIMYSLWLSLKTSYFWYKILGYIAIGIFCSLGFMTKGFLALVIPALSMFPWVITQKIWKEVYIYLPLVLFSALVVSLPWMIVIARCEPDFWHYFIWVEHIQRFAEENAQHKAPFWYYLPVVLLGILPWLALLPGALCHAWRERNIHKEGFYLLGWVVIPLLFFSVSKGKLPTYILPCFAPLSLLIARYAMTCSSLPLRVNGILNILFGLCGIVVANIFSSWGLVQYRLFTVSEGYKVLLILFSFLFWVMVGILTIRTSMIHWRWAALCPVGITILVWQAIPQAVIDAKQPQAFIKTIRSQLEKSRFILANSIGVAAGIAWELQRSDITLFECRGELAYGLSYPDAINRFIRKENFSKLLNEKTKEGSVTLVLLLTKNNIKNNYLPHADNIYQRGRLMLLEYYQHS